MDNNNNGSGVNTVLIVIVLVIIVAGLAWFFAGGTNDSADAGLNVDVNLPAGESGE